MNPSPHHLLLLVSGCLLAGCGGPERHPWQLGGDENHVWLDIRQWPVVPQELYVGVPESEIAAADELLEDRESLELTAEQEAVFNQHLERPGNPALRPYLIRGVKMGYPWYSILRRDPVTNAVSVHRATWNGEIFIPFYSPSFSSWPLVIYLEEPPLRVYPTAVYGGDWIMRTAVEVDSRPLVREETARSAINPPSSPPPPSSRTSPPRASGTRR